MNHGNIPNSYFFASDEESGSNNINIHKIVTLIYFYFIWNLFEIFVGQVFMLDGWFS